jgi:hypothetical protein
MDRLQDILQEQDFMDILRRRTDLGDMLRGVMKKLRKRKPGLFFKKTAKGKRELAKAIKTVALQASIRKFLDDDRLKVIKHPFTTAEQGIKYRDWLNKAFPTLAKEYEVFSSDKLSSRFKKSRRVYKNRYITKSLNHKLTWTRGSKKGQPVTVFEYYAINHPDIFIKKSGPDVSDFKGQIEADYYVIPKTLGPWAERMNKELFYINARPEYNGKPFFIADPRLNLVAAFDRKHKLIAVSHAIAGAGRQPEELWSYKKWCDISKGTYIKHTWKRSKYGQGFGCYELGTTAQDVKDGKAKFIKMNFSSLSRPDSQKAGIYQVRKARYTDKYSGDKSLGVDTYALSTKDGIPVGTAIHSLYTGDTRRIKPNAELKQYLQKQKELGIIPKKYVDVVERDFLKSKRRYDLSAGCFNVTPEFAQNPKVQAIGRGGTPVFIMSEKETDYLVQVDPGREGDYLLDAAGKKDGKCKSPSALKQKYGIQINMDDIT